MKNNHKYEMKLSLNVLRHLGLNLYSNIPAVISELVANAYDADAKEVKINIDKTKQKIIIKDDGHGMSLADINDKFLNVGYARRDKGEAVSPELERPVMGRKGIGKLSIFSIANRVEIHTIKKGTEKNGFILDRWKVEDEIKKQNKYHPEDIPLDQIDIKKGTKLVLTDFKKTVSYTSNYLRRRIARRFSVIEENGDFRVFIDEKPVTVDDRDYFNRIQFIWYIGEKDKEVSKKFKFLNEKVLDGDVSPKSGYKVKGWIGAVEKPSHLTHEGVNNNKVSILCRGKMAQEDILETFAEGGIYYDYLIGELNADFLDTDEQEDIATSSRQSINEDDPRYKDLRSYTYKILKKIQGSWTVLRNEHSKKVAVKKAGQVNPAIKDWFDSLNGDSEQEHATELFSTIGSLHYDSTEEEDRKKKELYKYGILAFEKLKLRKNLGKLKQIKSADDVQLAAIFASLTDIEANMYYDIASQRVEVIKKFQEQLDNNDKEKLLQKYLFDNLWLLNPSWERPTEGTEVMEQRVEKEFNKVVETLTKDEKKGRLDIKYRTAAGKHVIIELKRYEPTYKVTPVDLYQQIKKYRNALKKCIQTTKDKNAPIEAIAVIGKPFNHEDYEEAKRLLDPIDGRIIYYDTLIEESLKSYSDYLERQKKVSKIREILDKI